MMSGMYAAISGLDANQAMLNDVAGNLANVNTVGYKSSSMTFADSLTQVSRAAAGPTSTNGGSNPVQVGLGVQIESTRNEMTRGFLPDDQQPARHRDRGQRLPEGRIGHAAGQRTVHNAVSRRA